MIEYRHTPVRSEVAKLDRVSGVGESRRSLPRSTHADHHRTSIHSHTNMCNDVALSRRGQEGKMMG
jgi:hypothetical protein